MSTAYELAGGLEPPTDEYKTSVLPGKLRKLDPVNSIECGSRESNSGGLFGRQECCRNISTAEPRTRIERV